MGSLGGLAQPTVSMHLTASPATRVAVERIPVRGLLELFAFALDDGDARADDGGQLSELGFGGADHLLQGGSDGVVRDASPHDAVIVVAAAEAAAVRLGR